MWSIKTYWHAEGLPLPHSHTENTNSYSRLRYMHACMCMSHTHTGHKTTHTYTCTHKDKYWLESSHVCTINHAELSTLEKVMPKKQMPKKCKHASWFLIKHAWNGPKHAAALEDVTIFHCKTKIYRWVIMHHCMDMHPIRTYILAEKWLGELCFPSWGELYWGGELEHSRCVCVSGEE